MARIEPGIIRQQGLDSTFQQELASRDALLWIGKGVITSDDIAKPVASLAALPWSSVLSESSSFAFAEQLRELKDDSRLTKQRGYLDVIATNPADISLPARTLPIYFLNGLDKTDDPTEAVGLSRQKALLRRLTMLDKATDQQPRVLVLVSAGDPSVIENLVALWEDGFRARVIFVSNDEAEVARLESDFRKTMSVGTITLVVSNPADFAKEVVQNYFEKQDAQTLLVRVRDRTKATRTFDLSNCEREEQPILDRYDLLVERDLDPLLPEDLNDEEIAQFFQRSNTSWRPYAAGLPWERDRKYVKQVLKALRLAHERGPEQNKVLLVPTEPGSGGTTLMRQFAYQAAKEGYPTLVAKQIDFKPDAMELSSFLFDVNRQCTQAMEDAKDSSREKKKLRSDVETPALIAFDAQHWIGSHDLLIPFFRSFARSGRSVVVLIIADHDFVELVPTEVSEVIDASIAHSMSESAVLSLGNHLNRFLEPRGTGRSETEWKRFHSANQPTIGDFGTSAASFWIALEFWLKRQYDLGETIQAWIYKQFKDASFPSAIQREILRIAAATVERIGFPEKLIKLPEGSDIPASLILERARQQSPAIGLIRNVSAVSRQWAMGHVQVARYLLNLAFSDRNLMKTIGQETVTNPVAFRLELLRTIACDPLLSQKAYRDLADQFATTILKLDRDGNREFFVEWQRVLDILESVPERVWETSRVFNHHVAISRRRIASDEEYFPLTNGQRIAQLEGAEEHLTFALERIEATDNDESDLNLLNSLARTYQDLADTYMRMRVPREKVDDYRRRASECVQRAEQLNPTNSYVLETLSQDLIKKAETLREEDPSQAASLACEALSYVRRAMVLHSSGQRQVKLNDLLSQCFRLLAGEKARVRISQLRSRRDPVGVVAFAWLTIHDSAGEGVVSSLESVPHHVLNAALRILSEIESGRQGWIDLRLSYDILAIIEPLNFNKQLDLMDAIVLETRRSDLQTRLEHAILLYQVGRSGEGSSIFRDVRRELKESDMIVSVPDRLKFLYKPDGSSPEVCNAVVTEERGVRSYAAVQQLNREQIPFIPHQFNKARMKEGERFSCSITFGHNGPFISPVVKGHGGTHG